MDWSKYSALKAAAATMPALVPLVWSYEREAVAALLGAVCNPVAVIGAPRVRDVRQALLAHMVRTIDLSLLKVRPDVPIS